jgi:hypothetical protein
MVTHPSRPGTSQSRSAGPGTWCPHGDEAVPSLTIVRQGYGLKIIVVGATQISSGITSTAFRTVPDKAEFVCTRKLSVNLSKCT